MGWKDHIKACSRKKIIDGYEVEVTYNKLSDGTIKITDVWINP